MNGEGAMVVAWDENGRSGSTVFARRISPAGRLMDFVELPVSSERGESRPVVSMSRTSRDFVLAWTEVWFDSFDVRVIEVENVGSNDQVVNETPMGDWRSGGAISLNGENDYQVVFRRDLPNRVFTRFGSL
jgi:hypothetical protein